MAGLSDRRLETKDRVKALQARLTEAEKTLQGKACVYAIGSFGRGEASANSDLDLFIVGKTNDPRDSTESSLLGRLDEICVKADLIEATRALGIPEFDGEGRYLVHYSVPDLINTLGRPEDDANNTFTARLLLLLESQPILENRVYEEVISDVVAAYWGDYEDHKEDFTPAFLANDILRLWRTFCVNYEARTERQPDAKRIKRKVKNYKLKYSRMLTCYSALLYLLATCERQGTVRPLDVMEMIHLSPTQRLERLLQQPDLAGAHGSLENLLAQYDAFLGVTSPNEIELIALFSDKDVGRRHMDEASTFGDHMFEALKHIGKGSRFHRLLTV